jgi:hypothetical protein
MMILLTETELHHAPALASTTTLTSSEPAINPMAQFFGKKVARKFAIVRVKETEKDAQVRLVNTHKKLNTGTLPDEVILPERQDIMKNWSTPGYDQLRRGRPKCVHARANPY